MPIQTASLQPTLTAAEVANYLIAPLEQESTFLSAAGVQIFDSAGPLRIPRIASGATASFVSAGQQISDSNVSFDEVQLLPSSLRGIKSLTKLSNELIRQATHTVGALESVVQTRIVTDVANVLDASLFDGTGANDSIKGILRAPGIQTGVLDLSDPDSLIDGLAVAQGNHVNPSAWVMTPASFASIRKVKVGASDRRYVIEPNTIATGVAFTLFGLNVIVTDNIPNVGAKARVALVDFSKVAVARDQDVSVAVLDQTFGDFDTVAIRVTARFDTGLLQPRAVTVLTQA